MFEKMAYENLSGRRVYKWLLDTGYKSKNGKSMSVGNLYRLLKNPFYYGAFEYPVDSGNWYKVQHEPLITKETFDIVQVKVANNNCYVYGQKQLVYSKLFKCGYCGSSMVGEEKWKNLKNGNKLHYIYYGCCRGNDRFCKNVYIREDVLTEKLMQIMKNIKLNDLELTYNLKDQFSKYENFRRSVLGLSRDKKTNTSLDIKNYAKYILKEGTNDQKRELLGCIKNKVLIKDKELIIE